MVKGMEIHGSSQFQNGFSLVEYSEFPINPPLNTVIQKDGIIWSYSTIYGVLSWSPLTGNHKNGHKHLQAIASTSWTIKHDQNSDDFVLVVYSESGNVITPAEVVVVDNSEIEIKFGAPVKGKALFFFASELNNPVIGSNFMKVQTELRVEGQAVFEGGSSSLLIGDETLDTILGSINSDLSTLSDEVNTNVASQISTVTDSVLAEAARAKSAEATLQSNIDSSVITINTSINNLQNQFGNVDSDLIALSDAVNTSVASQLDTVITSLSVEETRAEAAEAALQSNINDNTSLINAQVSSITTALGDKLNKTGKAADADLLDGKEGDYYTQYADGAVAALVASAPAALDTLNELSRALGDDPNFATTVTNALGGKLGVNSTAANSNMLNGQDASYYRIDVFNTAGTLLN